MTDKRSLYRILDANFNRAREGLRVAEEAVRFAVDSAALQGGFKRCRHAVRRVLDRLDAGELLRSRRSGSDVGRKPSALESARRDLSDVFTANVQRAKESLRALEEFSKLVDARAAKELKGIRFRVYTLEKRALPKLEALRHQLRPGAKRTQSGRRGRRSRAGRGGRRPAAR